jgi:NAD(P)-dependent dehydrogenase (short-subunit alcohol dehydrogenase family)
MAGTPARTAVVTGATSGVGAATARLLARNGFDVVVAGRTRTSAEAAAEQVRLSVPEGTGGPAVDAAWGDLTRQSDVRRLADRVLDRHEHVAVLVNNAGANHPRRVLTEDGVERTLAVDALAPILLTTLLLPALRAARGRVVNVASGLLRTPDADRWTGPEPYSQMAAYAQAKAMLVLLTARMAQEHPDVLMVSMTPGMVRTGLDRDTSGGLRLFLAMVKLASKSPDDAARGLLHLAVGPAADLTTGAFYRRGEVERPRALADVDTEAAWRSALERLGIDARRPPGSGS